MKARLRFLPWVGNRYFGGNQLRLPFRTRPPLLFIRQTDIRRLQVIAARRGRFVNGRDLDPFDAVGWGTLTARRSGASAVPPPATHTCRVRSAPPFATSAMPDGGFARS